MSRLDKPDEATEPVATKSLTHLTANIDMHKMLEEIDDLVGNDWAFDMMDTRQTYTQEDAQRMGHLIGQVYMVAHCIHCTACQRKYIKQ